jgi:outer membrane protein OmpA-like peptidoglycan-associated protein
VNRFITGFIVFLFYAVLCFSFLELALPSLGISSLTMSKNSGMNEDFKNSFNSVEPQIQNEITFEEVAQDLAVDTTSIDLEPTLEIFKNEPSSDAVTSSPVSTESSDPTKFNVTLPNGVLLLSCDSFATVYKDVEKVKIPFPCRDYGLTIRTYLEENPKATLLITGFSDPSEVSTLGKNRADYVKRLLINTGIVQDRILTTLAIRNLNIDNGYASGGVRMEIKGTVPANSSVVSGTPDSAFKVMTENTGASRTLASKKFTSGFQGNYFYGDQKFTSYTATIKTLLSQNPMAKVYAYSYTNVDGDDKDNFAISRDNSSTVRKILMQSGIPATKIQSVARGEQNSGTGGSNRCIIITVK